MTLLVGIDVGTQSAKVVVHDADGAVVAEGRAPLRPPLTPSPGVVEHPGEDLWDALAAACRDATAALGADVGAVSAVGLCGVRFCRALLRADGSLAAPVMSWMDERVARPHRQPDGDAGDEVAWVASSSGYLTQRLTGRFRDSVASYQGQWPVDSRTWDWLADDTELAAYGVPRDRLMELVVPGQVLGEVTPAAAAATGLPVGVPVVATANDKAVEALGSGLRSAEDLLVSLGTYVAAMTVGATHHDGSAASWTNFSAVPGEHLHESTGIRRGMWTVTWLRELLTAARLASTPLVTGEAERLLDAGAADVPAGSDGLVTLLDWLAPVEEPWRRGAFVGLDARHGPFHLHRSVLEALALTMRGHARAMTDELGTTPRRVVLSGGGSRSDLMLQIVADVFDLPTSRGAAPSAAALGAAMSAAVAAGVHGSFDEAVAAMVHADRSVEPTAAGRSTYAGMRGLHTDVTAALDPVLRRHRDLFA
jgi:sugar (pentulose or hexulose) kinase